ncbi:MAG: M56 family metallopeptidase [Acidobacteria bacterium]|nr:M56 family metallopeptidase [Acidobacteriota bacterium]
MTNLWIYCVQVTVVVAFALAGAQLLRAGQPKYRLYLLQGALALCILLPLQPRDHPRQAYVQAPPIHITVSESAVWGPPLTPERPWVTVQRVLAAGVLLRALWLAAGLLTLARYRRRAEYIDHRNGAAIAASGDVAAPVTFGFFDPIVLLPKRALALPEEAREAVLAHELIHVRRSDWLQALAEEFVKTLLWFHPAIWLLISRIRLAREEAVDREVVDRDSNREVYIGALAGMAGSRLQPYLAAAPRFLRSRQLKTRLTSLLQEKPMPQFRRLFVVIALTLAATVAVTRFRPLTGAPQIDPGNSAEVSVEGAVLVLRTAPTYPRAARRAGVEGPVVLDLALNELGGVSDARVHSGPMELRGAALQAVLEWRFQPGPRFATATLRFRRPTGVPERTIHALEIHPSVPAEQAASLRSRLADFMDAPFADSDMIELSHRLRGLSPPVQPVFRQTMANGVERNVVELRPLDPLGSGLAVEFPSFKPGANRIRVGGAIQAASLISKPDVEYPALARQARIQGTVRFNVLVGEEGAVHEVQVLHGHPLLIPNASQAVRQYRYKPTTLEGKPVEVLTQIDVNFKL